MNVTNTTDTSPKVVVWYLAVRAAISFLSVLGNSFVMFLIVKSRRLRVIPNAFIFALAFADTLVCAVITPSDFACTYHPHSCDAPKLRMTFDILIHFSVTNLCALTFDRYMAIVRPLSYRTFMTRRRVAAILTISLVSAATVPIVGYICRENILAVNIVRVLNTIFLQILPPILLAATYVRMVYIAKQHEKKDKIQQIQLKFNYENTSLAEHKEKASTQMIGAVIIVFILCYILVMFRSLYFYIMNKNIPITVTQVSRILLLINSAANVVVYAFLKQDFKREFRRMVKQIKTKLTK